MVFSSFTSSRSTACWILLAVQPSAKPGADLPTELIELLEKIVLHNSDFSAGLSQLLISSNKASKHGLTRQASL